MFYILKGMQNLHKAKDSATKKSKQRFEKSQGLNIWTMQFYLA